MIWLTDVHTLSSSYGTKIAVLLDIKTHVFLQPHVVISGNTYNKGEIHKLLERKSRYWKFTQERRTRRKFPNLQKAFPLSWVSWAMENLVFPEKRVTLKILKSPEKTNSWNFCFFSVHYVHSGWCPRDIQRWTVLFQTFDVFQRWFRVHEKQQCWSALVQTRSALTFSESALIKSEKFSAEQRCFRDNQLWISAVHRWFC